jgi:hypothetical protein
MKFELVLSLAPCAFGWGNKGHRIVASIAHSHLSNAAARDLRRVLGVGPTEFESEFVRISTQADGIDDEEIAEYHFVHSPFQTCEAYVESRDCGFNQSGRCLVTGITKYASEFISSETPSGRLFATKMLVHLMADLHQPLHVGFSEDHGGLDIEILSPPDHSLHTLWDTYLLQSEDIQASKLVAFGAGFRKGENPFAGYRDESGENGSLESFVHSWVSTIVSEMSSTYTCPKAYRDEFGAWLGSAATLTDAYLSDRSRIASELLAIAGVRTAVLFNALVKHVDQRESRLKMTENEAIQEKGRLAAERTKANNPTNIYTLLEIDDITFDLEDMEQLKATGSKPVGSKKNSSKKAPISPEDLTAYPIELYGVKLDDLLLWKSPRGGWIVTYRRNIENHRRIDAGLSVWISFPKNAGSKQVHLWFDSDIFLEKNLADHEFIRVILYRLRGIRRKYHRSPIGLNNAEGATIHLRQELVGYENSAALISHIPIGATVVGPTGEHNFTRVSQKPESEIESELCGLELTPESDADELKRREVRRKVANLHFPTETNWKLLAFRSIMMNIGRLCDSIVKIRFGNQAEFYTTLERLRRSELLAKKPLRFVIAVPMTDEVTHEDIQQLIDPIIMDERPNPRAFQDEIIYCAEENIAGNMEALRIRPSLPQELGEVVNTLKNKLSRPSNPDPIVDQIIAYTHRHSILHPTWFIEWNRK